MAKITAIDLFCGIGGLTYGLQKAGIKVNAGVDQDKSCKYAFEKNNDTKFIGDDVSNIDGTHLKNEFWCNNDIRVLVGCAPCQPFSSHSNKISDTDKQKTTKWSLLNEFLRIIEESNPHIISMENVPNLANKAIFKDYVQTLLDRDYRVYYKNVYCPDYGIPQKRRRLVLLASKLGDIELIPPTTEPKNYKTVKDALGKLEILDNGESSKKDPLHFTSTLSEKNLQRIQASKPNGTWLDWDYDLRLECHKKDSGSTYKSVYGRMSWDEPSPTITTQFYNYGTGRFGHPEQDRALTIREAAILQTFPKKYEFYENVKKISIGKIGIHIGNAVPVKLGYVIGRSILKHVEQQLHE